jgi:pyruvate dehydrogenase E1 component alpha subunit
MTGHSAHDPADYVPKHLFQEWAEKDPIRRLERRAVEEGWAGRDQIDQLYAGIRREVDEAIEWAENSPLPDPSLAFEGVYDSPDGGR